MAVRALAVSKRDRIRFTLIGFICLFFILMTDYMGFFQGMNSHIYDLCFRLRGPETPADQIVIAAIDENTLEKLGKWPISRIHYGTFLDRVSKASAIVFDIILAEPSPQDPELEPAIAKGKTFLPVYFDNSGHLVPPSPLLGSPSVGHVHLEPSVDGVSRQVFHTLIQDGKPLSSLASVVHDFLFPSDRKAPPLAFPGTGSQNENTILQLDPMRINFYGPRGTFPYLSFSDILENKFPRTFFDNKIIMVGLTAAGIDQDHLTPFNINRTRMPGVEIQANILNNLMDGTSIKEVSSQLMSPVLFLVLFSSFFLFVQMGTPRSVMAWAAASIVLSAVTFFLLSRFHIWVAPVVFYAALTAALVIAHIFNLERMGALLFQAKKDWEVSFDSITDAIIVQDLNNRRILSNRSAKDGPSDFFDRYFKLCANPSLDPSTLGLSIGEDTKNHAEIFDTTLKRYFEIRRFSRTDEKNLPNGTVHFIKDITQRKNFENEQAMFQSQRIHSQKMEAIGTLAGGIAHDFNNILSAIMGYTQIAAVLIPKESEAQEKLEEVLKASSRAASLTMQILSFSRQTEQDKLPVTLRPIVKEVLKLLKATLSSAFEFKANIQGRQKVKGDPGQIYQVFLNLCINASQAMGDGPGQIEVTLESIDIDSPGQAGGLDLPMGRYVKTSVADTGCGIPEEIKERIFEPYFTTKGKSTGSGLGLATIHGIIKKHGGGIWFESRENVGTTFHVYLPEVESPGNKKSPGI